MIIMIMMMIMIVTLITIRRPTPSSNSARAAWLSARRSRSTGVAGNPTQI